MNGSKAQKPIIICQVDSKRIKIKTNDTVIRGLMYNCPSNSSKDTSHESRSPQNSNYSIDKS